MVVERRIVVQRFTSDPKTEVTAIMVVDVDDILQTLAERAWANKGKKTLELGGAIKCRVYAVKKVTP